MINSDQMCLYFIWWSRHYDYFSTYIWHINLLKLCDGLVDMVSLLKYLSLRSSNKSLLVTSLLLLITGRNAPSIFQSVWMRMANIQTGWTRDVAPPASNQILWREHINSAFIYYSMSRVEFIPVLWRWNWNAGLSLVDCTLLHECQYNV